MPEYTDHATITVAINPALRSPTFASDVKQVLEDRFDLIVVAVTQVGGDVPDDFAPDVEGLK